LEQYEVHRKKLVLRHGKGGEKGWMIDFDFFKDLQIISVFVEKRLFHGCKTGALQKILSGGFDMRVAVRIVV
jgi:hypothetical protein